ncbi:helix-turn-helix domain-containing protein [Aquipseudomonas alcaligenes]|uniref:helix-turn-helix domain-containing protein n=1 Tax=Aquipseudomonas alcaligenes TaxID=43263 RepID=UPI00364C0365
MSNDNPNIKTSNSQRAEIRRYLEDGNSLTALQALNHFGCARLASRIDELRQDGMSIETHWLWVENRNGKRVRVAEYRLAQGAAA